MLAHSRSQSAGALQKQAPHCGHSSVCDDPIHPHQAAAYGSNSARHALHSIAEAPDRSRMSTMRIHVSFGASPSHSISRLSARVGESGTRNMHGSYRFLDHARRCVSSAADRKIASLTHQERRVPPDGNYPWIDQKYRNALTCTSRFRVRVPPCLRIGGRRNAHTSSNPRVGSPDADRSKVVRRRAVRRFRDDVARPGAARRGRGTPCALPMFSKFEWRHCHAAM